MSLQSGLDAFKIGRYQEAIELLEEFSRNCVDEISPDYLNAQMWLLKAYQATGKIEKARELCQQLMSSDNLEIRAWAEKAYPTLPEALKTPSPSDRAPTANVNLAMKGVGGSLALASNEASSKLDWRISWRCRLVPSRCRTVNGFKST
jgi:tetratricopeptide (TPR) repeat protein